MEVPETQVVETPEGVHYPNSQEILAKAMGIAPPEARQAPAQAEVQPTATVTDTPTPAPTAQETPADTPAEVPAEVDPYERAITAPAPTSLEWSEDALKPFEATFGTKDPSKFKEEYETLRTQAELNKAELEKWTAVGQRWETLSPAQKHAMELMLGGKGEEAQEYIRTTPSIVFQNREAKNIDTETLIKTYFPGKLSDEQFKMLKDPEADPDLVDALKARIDILRAGAVDLHESQRKQAVDRTTAEAEAQRQAFEAHKQATAASIAHAKSTPLGHLMDQDLVQAFTTGSFLSKFVQEDGVTPTQEAATLLLKALHHDKLMAAKGNVEYKRGLIDGELKASSRQPSVHRAVRDTGGAPQDNTPSLKDKILASI